MKRFAVITLSINSALLFCGCAIVGYGLYLKFGDDLFTSILRKGKPWDCDNVLLIAGSFIATGALMRLAGTLKMKKRIMLWSIVSTALAFISALSVIIMVYGFYYEPKEYAVKSVTEQIKENYGQTDEGKNGNGLTPATTAIDNIQKQYKCCGAKGYTDWQGSQWSSDTGFRVPKSCCNTIDYKTCLDKSGNVSTIFQENCSKELENWAVKNIPMLGGLGFVTLVLAICAGVLTAFMVKHL